MAVGVLTLSLIPCGCCHYHHPRPIIHGLQILIIFIIHRDIAKCLALADAAAKLLIILALTHGLQSCCNATLTIDLVAIECDTHPCPHAAVNLILINDGLAASVGHAGFLACLSVDVNVALVGFIIFALTITQWVGIRCFVNLRFIPPQYFVMAWS